MNEKEKYFLKYYAPNIERLHKIGIRTISCNPGYLITIEKGFSPHSVDLRESFIAILCDLIKKVHPDTLSDAEMRKAYKKRMKNIRGK